MTEVKYAYHLKRSAILLGILFFGWFTGFSYQQIDQTSNWLEVGRSATLTVEQTKTLLAATTAIFALLTIMSLIALANSFISSRCRLIFGDSAVSYPKGHVFPKTIEVPYRDIISIERINAQFNEAMAVTTLQGKHVIQKGMMKNEAAFTEAYEYLKKKIEARG